MSIRNLIIATMIIPIVFFVAAWIFIQVYRADLFRGNTGFSTEEFEIYGVDAALLSGSYNRFTVKASQAMPLLLMVADLHMDRNWNAATFSSNSGHNLADAMAVLGMESIRYDHRGTGKTKASRDSYYDFALKAEDLRSIYLYARRRISQPLILLAHGSACHLVLHALVKWQFEIKGLFLVSCGGGGDLIGAWARKLFFNMKRKGVQKSILDKAKQEWQLWQKTAQVLPIEGASHPDLNAFRVALQFFASPAMASFRKHGSKLRFFSLVRKQLAKRKIHILHITAAYDEERPFVDQQTTRHFAKQMQSHSVYRNFYSFQELANCDFFLRKQENKLQGVTLILSRLNPFPALDPTVSHLLQDTVLAWSK